MFGNYSKLPKDIIGYQLSSYTVALEGWRRGLDLKFNSSRRGSPYPAHAYRYTLSDGVTEYTFNCARGSLVSKTAIDICGDKSLTYKYLDIANIPIPKGKLFENMFNLQEVISFCEEIGYPVVIKATSLGGGRGVYTNLSTIEEIQHALRELETLHKVEEFIVEKFFTGTDYRFYVVGDKMVAATKFFSSNVIGDGKHSIKELVNLRNDEINKNPFYKKRLINIDQHMVDYLKEQKLTLDSIPIEEERVYLRRQGEYLYYRIPKDMTDMVTENIKSTVVNAVKAIPGLNHASVDMIINQDMTEYVINEINSRGEIGMHVFPIEGESRDVPKAIIDYYFPHVQERNLKWHFEFQPIKEMFLKGHASEVKIPAIAQREMYSTNLYIQSKNVDNGFIDWLRRKIAQSNLATENFINTEDTITLTLHGPKFKINNLIKTIEETKFLNGKIVNVKRDKIVNHKYSSIAIDF